MFLESFAIHGWFSDVYREYPPIFATRRLSPVGDLTWIRSKEGDRFKEVLYTNKVEGVAWFF